jgi:tetratricopeptide (TPR) repeat protein
MATIRAVILREKRRRGGPRRGVVRAVVCLAFAVVLVARGLTGAVRADDASEARRHAQRATSLAASGKCKQAVVEFDKALAILRDPALLFNRGECHRKLGDTDAAIDDYKQFLSDLPQAPNRAEVQERIADLQHKSAVAAASAASDAGQDHATRGAMTRPRGPGSGVRATPSPSSRANAPVAPREVILAAPSPAAGSESDTGDAEHRGAAIETASDTAPSSASDSGVAGRPWFWMAVAVAAVGAGVGAFVLLNRDSTSVPSSALGNYKF